MIPVRERGHDQMVNVRQNLTHRFALYGSRLRQLRFKLAGFDLREHGQFLYVLEVIRNPINDLAPELAKILRAHIAKGRRKPMRARF